MTTELEQIAREAVERHIGDVMVEYTEPSSKEIYEEAYVIAFDALVDSLVDFPIAREVADKVAKEMS